jgi:TM2 domain-containing membrane protein YozV
LLGAIARCNLKAVAQELIMETRKPEAQEKHINKVANAYILWLACLLQLNGLHRLYNGKIGTGLLWLCTFGLFGVGQLVDLFLIPNMVDEYNIKLKAKMGISTNGVPLSQPVYNEEVVTVNIATTDFEPSRNQLMVLLLKAAAARNGKLSVTQAVMDTGASFAEVEAILKEMVKSGYVGVDNHPDTGIVIYKFLEL